MKYICSGCKKRLKDKDTTKMHFRDPDMDDVYFCDVCYNKWKTNRMEFAKEWLGR